MPHRMAVALPLPRTTPGSLNMKYSMTERRAFDRLRRLKFGSFECLGEIDQRRVNGQAVHRPNYLRGKVSSL